MAAAACLAAACGIGQSADAAPARIRFHIEPQAYSEALLDIAQQANVTLIGAASCSGQSSVRLSGTMTLEQALTETLAGARCTWRLIAPGAVEISPVPRVEPPRPEPPVTVADVLVTATKRIRNARELAVAITTIPREGLEATGASDAGEAASQFAGVLVTNLGPGRNKLLLRGLSDGAHTGRTRSTVATYLDDVPVNYNAPDPDLRLVDVERIEVARGPQGALFGAGSLSGVYRIVTRKPDLGDFSSELRATGAITRGGAPSGAVEGHVNIPLSSLGLGIRLAAYEEVQGGYLDDVIRQQSNVDQTERRGGRVMIAFRPNDAWSVTLTAAGQHLRSRDTHYTAPGLGLRRAVRIREPHVNDIELLTATIRRSWGWGDLVSSTGAIQHRYSSVYNSTATKRLYTVTGDTSAYFESTQTRMLVQDIFMTSRGAGRLEWLAGLYGSYTAVKSPTEFSVQVPRAPLIPVYSDDRRDRVRELAAYGEASYRLTPDITLAAGARAFSIHTRTKSDVVSENFAPRAIARTVDFQSISPKLSLQWTFHRGDLAYAVVSEGYRSGGVNSGGAVPLAAQRATFRPDRLINFEAGLKLEDLYRGLSLNSAVFYDIWKDIQTDQFRPSGIPYTINAGDARVLGVETEMALRRGGFTAQVNGRIASVRTSNGNADFTARLVNGLPGAPALSGGALLSYEHSIAGDWTVRVVGQATYVGPSRVTFDASQARTGGFIRTKLSAEVYGAVAGLPVGLQVFVLNPLDSFSDTFAFGNPFNPDQARQITPQRPVTVGVTLSAAI